MDVVRVLAIAVALSISPAFAQQSLPLASMTCKAFIDSSRDTRGIILTWLLGRYHDDDEPWEIDFKKMEDMAKKLGTYCGKNPTHALQRAVENVME